jgi:ASPIC and UnbV
LVSNFTNEPARIVLPLLYENTTSHGNWLDIRLEGTSTNRDAFGTVVEVKANGKSYKKYHHGAQFYGQSILPLHFGLADFQRVDSIFVTWLGGETDTVGATDVNQTIHIVQGGGSFTGRTIPPDGLALLGNYPNPFNSSTTLCFMLGIPGEVELRILTTLGQTVAVIHTSFSTVGEKTLAWHAIDRNALPLSTGVYFYRLRIATGVAKVGKMILVK